MLVVCRAVSTACAANGLCCVHLRACRVYPLDRHRPSQPVELLAAHCMHGQWPLSFFPSRHGRRRFRYAQQYNIRHTTQQHDTTRQAARCSRPDAHWVCRRR
jgi:hypothetical protein